MHVHEHDAARLAEAHRYLEFRSSEMRRLREYLRLVLLVALALAAAFALAVALSGGGALETLVAFPAAMPLCLLWAWVGIAAWDAIAAASEYLRELLGA
ncbi:MAG: hypothetical protein OXH83_07120 [Bryobacterales bacterium]|nr:hypothetical protein [Bryobacterales bacterium]